VRTIANKVEREWSGADKLVVVPEGLSLVDRIKYINARAIDGDVCIELHMNAGGGNGTETLYYAGSETARDKADVLNTRISKGLGTTNRGAKPDTISRFGRLGFIRDTKPLALLVELGFIDNAGDRDRVWTGAKVVAEAIKKI
jgi:N-acetylmuramoyl-L-alanine amidase